MSNLLEQKCRVGTVTALTGSDLQHHLAQVNGWQLVDAALEKTFKFKDDLETMAFVNALAWVSHVEDHHADLAVSYNRCVVRFATHSAGGISINDFICAAKADALVAFVG